MVRFICKTDTLNYQNLQLRSGLISRLCEKGGDPYGKGLAGTGSTINNSCGAIAAATAAPQHYPEVR